MRSESLLVIINVNMRRVAVSSIAWLGRLGQRLNIQLGARGLDCWANILIVLFADRCDYATTTQLSGADKRKHYSDHASGPFWVRRIDNNGSMLFASQCKSLYQT